MVLWVLKSPVVIMLEAADIWMWEFTAIVIWVIALSASQLRIIAICSVPR